MDLIGLFFYRYIIISAPEGSPFLSGNKAFVSEITTL